MSDQVTIARMTTGELAQVMDWAAAEGWNPGLDDAAAFHAADPQGFFLARKGGTPAAAISVVNHDDDHAFLGLYICHPEFRGQGIGYRTWTHALETAGTRTVGLDGVPEQEANYRASGFQRTGASLRHEGRWPGQTSSGIRAASPGDIEALTALDATAVGHARRRFLAAWVGQDSDRRATRVLERDGEIAGFATWRACAIGTKIGPVIAPDTASALALIADIANERPDGPLIVDVPEANTALRSELEGAGFQIPFATARMYRGTPPEAGASLQSIATMELG
ncbi:GNAT family N-acetyltransferase [Marinibacterium profundimaris]|nr:GNAT family N-acetyltransferase [Marinibacterium profundimaris]